MKYVLKRVSDNTYWAGNNMWYPDIAEGKHFSQYNLFVNFINFYLSKNYGRHVIVRCIGLSTKNKYE